MRLCRIVRQTSSFPVGRLPVPARLPTPTDFSIEHLQRLLDPFVHMLASPRRLCEHTRYVQPRDLLARFHVARSNPSPTGQTTSWLVSDNLLGPFQQGRGHYFLNQRRVIQRLPKVKSIRVGRVRDDINQHHWVLLVLSHLARWQWLQQWRTWFRQCLAAPDGPGDCSSSPSEGSDVSTFLASRVSPHQLALWQWQLTTVANDHAFPSVLRHALTKCDPDQRALELLALESPQVAILYTHPEQATTPRTFRLTHQSVLGVHYVLLCPWQVVEEFRKHGWHCQDNLPNEGSPNHTSRHTNVASTSRVVDSLHTKPEFTAPEDWYPYYSRIPTVAHLRSEQMYQGLVQVHYHSSLESDSRRTSSATTTNVPCYDALSLFGPDLLPVVWRQYLASAAIPSRTALELCQFVPPYTTNNTQCVALAVLASPLTLDFFVDLWRIRGYLQ
ncbi:hypothetical protein IWQ61_007781 [Dispira simplex]|nr:hypothetical protein IWQ61_007781 [Dispira simplex]